MSTGPYGDGRPRYADLPGARALGLHGPDEQLGALNLLTAGRVKAAASLVRSGEVFSLNASLNHPFPHPVSTFSPRRPPVHRVFRTPTGRDDCLDGFFPQYSSQWDGFLHVRDVEHQCFYNGNTDESRGIEAWAERGIAGRGVLLDIARWRDGEGRPVDWRARDVASVDDLRRCAVDSGVAVEPGTVLLLRHGWEMGWSAASPAERREVADGPFTCPGIEPSEQMLELLWDWGVAAVASDTFTVEPWPFEGFSLHSPLLNRLGIPLGELWHLDALAVGCRAAGRYEFLLTSAPLNVPGGVGSPANALAIL